MIILGDIHGAFQYLIELLEMFDFKNESIISVGDFGLGFNDYYFECGQLTGLNKELRKRGLTLYVIRGNHDNPSYWSGSNQSDDPGFSNIILVADYTTLTIEGKKVLFIGGGISIDRRMRTEGMNYWEDEKIVRNDQFIYSLPENSIDLVVTHCPVKNLFTTVSVPPHLTVYDKALISDLVMEQFILESYNAILKETQKDSLKMWFSGHLHISSTVYIDNIKYVVLNINEFYEVR